MGDLKSLFEVFGHDDTKEEVYTTDQKKRYWRAQKGPYSRTKGLFNFLHLIKYWEEIVGEMMAKNTVPLKVKGRTLYINTKHAIFAQELGFLGPEILKKIKMKFPELGDKIQNIKFSHSSFSADSFKNTHTKQQMRKPKEKRKLHPQSPEYRAKMRKAQEMFAHIEDEEVKARLIQFMLDQ